MLRKVSLCLVFFLIAGCATTASDVRTLRNKQDIEGLISIINESFDKDLRIKAIAALGVIRDPRAVKALTKTLESDSWVEREAAVKALGNLRDYLVIDPLVASLNDQNKFVRESAHKSLIKVATSLGKQKDPRVVRYLIKAMGEAPSATRSSTEEAFHAAIDELARVHEPTFIKPLIEAVEHQSRYVRQQAALALGDFDDPRVVKPLTIALKDSSIEVREAATQSLRRIQTPEAAEPLFEALHDKDEDVRAEAAHVLGMYKDPQVINKIIRSLDNQNHWVRTGAAKALEQLVHPRAMEKLVSLLGDDYADVRQAAAQALEQYHWRPHNDKEAAKYCVAKQQWDNCAKYGKNAIEPLVAALNGHNPDIRRRASQLLTVLKWEPADDEAKGSFCVARKDWEKCVSLGKAAIPALIHELQSDQWRDRMNAADTLAKIHDPEAISALINALQEDDNADVRAALVEALATYKQKQVVPPLIKALDDHNRAVRKTAARVLESSMPHYRKLNDPQISKAFVAALQDNNRGVRLVAAKLLGELQDPATANALIAALDDVDTDVRIAAKKSLYKIKDNRAIGSLVAGLKADKPEVRSEVIGALSEYQDHRAIEPLLESVNDSNAEVRIKAIKALSKLDDPRTIEPLIDALKDYQPTVRQATASTLANVDDPRVIPPLKNLLDDLDEGVREATRKTLLTKGWQPKNKEEQARYCIAKHDWLKCEALGKVAIAPLLLELKQEESPYQVEAARVLGEIGDPSTIQPFIEAIGRTQWYDDEYKRKQLLETTTRALAKFGIQAVPALKATLTQWYTAEYTAKALGRIGWQPRTDEDEIHYLVAKRANNDLQALWPDAKRVLLKDIKSKQADKISNALYAFIGIGKEEVIGELLKLLDDNGTIQIAEAYLNSGNDRLVDGANSWTRDRGLVVHQYAKGNSPVQWGQL
ncbi:MAG: HEAT repeat domain-containing protein [Gammaproteobacteria bacterium]|jgi:HEAT repeat protein